MKNYSVKNMRNYYTKENLLNQDSFEKIFEGINNEYIRYDADKKKMQKIMIKEYVNFIRKYEDEVFDTLGVFLGNKEIEKVVLFTRYNKNLDYNELLKVIKKTDKLNLVNLIIYQQLVVENKTEVRFASKLKNEDISDDFTSNCKILGIDKNTVKKQLDILLATVNMIKAIKYNYNNTSILCFDKDNKDKKAFVGKKLCLINNGYYFVGSNEITVQDFTNYLKENHKLKNKYTGKELWIEVNAYLGFVKQNNEIIDDEYTKLILDEKYNACISDRIDKPTSVYKGNVDISAFTCRKVLMPKNGILLLVKDNKMVESILLKEVFKFDRNNFVVITRFKDGKELTNVVVLSQDTRGRVPFYTYTKERCEGNPIALEYILHFLNIAKGSIVNEKHIFRNDTFLSYEVISPTYWKYRDRDYKSENDEIDHRGIVVKREFEIEIAAFIRKIQGRASDEAKSLAKKLGVILEDGHTIVRPHTRHYNKVK